MKQNHNINKHSPVKRANTDLQQEPEEYTKANKL